MGNFFGIFENLIPFSSEKRIQYLLNSHIAHFIPLKSTIAPKLNFVSGSIPIIPNIETNNCISVKQESYVINEFY